MSSSFLAIVFTLVVLGANLFNRFDGVLNRHPAQGRIAASVGEISVPSILPSNSVSPVASSDATGQPQAVQAPFAEIPDINAGSYLLWGERKGLMLAKNIYTPLPIASITKLMTATLFRDSFPDDGVLTVSGDTSALAGLYLGERVSKDAALELLLIPSNNAVAGSMAAALGRDFVEKMNGRARELGLTHTVFADPAGLDPDTRASSADILTLIRAVEARYPELLAITRTPSVNVVTESGNTYQFKNTNELLLRTFGILGGKTGYTDAAGGCLVAEFERNGERFIGVILGSADRFRDMETLIEYAGRF